MKKILTIAMAFLIVGATLPLSFANAQSVTSGTTGTQSEINTLALEQALVALYQQLATLVQEYNTLIQQQSSSVSTPALSFSAGQIGTAASTSNVVATSTPTSTSQVDLGSIISQVVQNEPIVSSAPAPVSNVKLSKTEMAFAISVLGNQFASPTVHLRSDDPTNCPTISYATTTQNIANIDAYMNSQTNIAGNSYVVLDNGVAESLSNVIGGWYANGGDSIVINGNFLLSYCENLQPSTSMSPSWEQVTLPPLTSASSYAFTMPAYGGTFGWNPNTPQTISPFGQFYETSSTW